MTSGASSNCHNNSNTVWNTVIKIHEYSQTFGMWKNIQSWIVLIINCIQFESCFCVCMSRFFSFKLISQSNSINASFIEGIEKKNYTCSILLSFHGEFVWWASRILHNRTWTIFFWKPCKPYKLNLWIKFWKKIFCNKLFYFWI